MKIKLLLFLPALFLAACAATEPGLDETQKTKLAGHASAWASKVEARNFDESFQKLFASNVDFNNKQVQPEGLAQVMAGFIKKDPKFSISIEEDSWVVDSVRGHIYAGHLDGVANYQGLPDTAKLSLVLWMQLPENGDPKIVGQFDNIGAAQSSLEGKFEDYMNRTNPFNAQGEPNYFFWSSRLDSLRKTVPNIGYICTYQQKNLYYAANQFDNVKWGIIDETGNVVLPYLYDAIGTIGIFGDGIVEVRQGDLYGLMRMDGGILLPTEYDALLPVYGHPQQAYWAQQNGKWQALDANGSPIFAESGQNAVPNFADYLGDLPMASRWNPRDPACTAAKMIQAYCNEEYGYLGSYNIVLPPLTLLERKIVDMQSTGSFEMEDGRLQTIDSVYVSENGRIQMLTTVESWGIGGRESYHDLEQKWVVLEPEAKKVAQTTTLYYKALEYSECSTGEMTILGDTMVQSLQNSWGSYLDYSSMPLYSYFRITSDSLVPLYKDRRFAFMSAVAVNADFLKGCFYGPATDEESAEYWRSHPEEKEEEYIPIIRIGNHFKADDLDFLINEVYASYGYIFEKEKFKTYFSDQSWYKPTSKNVDAKLTALEKKNIEYVRKLQAQIRKNEDSYTQATFSQGDYY